MAGEGTRDWSCKVFSIPPPPCTEIRRPLIDSFLGCTLPSNLKRFLLGTHHKVEPKHLQRYVAEFNYRLNRRTMETNLFDRLVRASLTTNTIIYKELIAVPDQA